MLKTIILKISSILLISLAIYSFYAYGKSTQENQYQNHKSADSGMQKNLNNEATPFGEYLYIGSIHSGDRIFYNRDNLGTYHDWKTTQDFFSIPSSVNVDNVFRYKDEIVCNYRKDNENSVIVLYDKDLNVKKSIEVEGIFTPEYIYNNLCYGYSYTSEKTSIQSINLSTMEIKTIYSDCSDDTLNVVIGNDGEIIIDKSGPGSKNCYYRYSGGVLKLILETKSSSPVCYDARGLFYLESTDSESTMNLMLWNGQNSQIIESVKTNDMNEWLFANGIAGNVIIDHDFVVTIHQAAKEPYVLIQQVGTQRSEKESLTKWGFSEGDMERHAETFSGIYYENGKIVNYFFSLKARELQTQTIDMKEFSHSEKYNEEPTISLNDFVTPLENDLFIKSMHINLVFSSEDDQGNYHTWTSPEKFFHTSYTVRYVLNYGNLSVCIGSNGDQDEITVYNENMAINKQRKIGNFTPKYSYGNMLYGDEYSESFDNRLIKSINLDNLKTEDIYSYGGNVGESQFDFIIDSSGNVIVYKINDERNKTFYYQCDNGKLKPILETKLSVPIYYDFRGLFYLETDGSFYSGQTSEANLMLWNGSSVQKVAKIKTEDMNGELFANGIPGNVIVYNDNIISIHQSAKEPYVLVQKINSSECKKKLLKTWNFTEADMERNGETFSGIYFKNGRITNYFYSKTAGMLQTQVIDII